MVRESKLIPPDRRWDYLPSTHEDLQETAATWRQASGVPLHIADMLQVSRDLFEFAYFKYDFCLVASVWALLTLEAALRDCLEDSHESAISLKNLISRAVERDLFSDDEARFLEAGRELRNLLAHPSRHSVYTPAMAAEIIRSTHAAVGDLYARLNQKLE